MEATQGLCKTAYAHGVKVLIRWIWRADRRSVQILRLKYETNLGGGLLT